MSSGNAHQVAIDQSDARDSTRTPNALSFHLHRLKQAGMVSMHAAC